MQVLKDLWRSRGLLWVLTKREIAARFAGSAGGMLWAWVQPILNIAAYYLVFDVVFAMRMGEHAPTDRVGTFLIVGMLAWMSFSEAVQRGMSSLVEAGGILQKNPLPPVLFPARAVLASALIYAPLLLGLVLAYWPKHHGSPAVVAMLPLVLSQVLLAWLLGYLLAILMAALTMFPERWRWLLWLNPMTAWVLGYQAILLQGRWPDWHVWVTMGVWLVVAACLLALALRRSRDQLVDWL
jgi:lipopolysaccharide transport system permease protein